jgi:putative hemolysin
MPASITETIIILILILFNGVFALSEISIVSSRKSRLEQWAKGGDEGARAALALANNPNKFLATIQVGMTCAAILTGVFAGSALEKALAGIIFADMPSLKPYARPIGFGVVFFTISYLTLILGELTPKRIGLANAEKMACIIGRPMWWLSNVTAPVIKLLNGTTDFIVKLLNIEPNDHPAVTSDEINLMIEHGTEAGVFQEAEEDMVKAVLKLGSRRVTALMTPRPKLLYLDINSSNQEIMSVLASAPPTRLLVVNNDLDNLLGYVFTRQVLAQPVISNGVDINACLKQPLFVPDNKTVLQVLDMFKHSGTHIAVVLDEYGDVQGIVTMTDVLKAIVGQLDAKEEPVDTILSEDCCWLLDGFLPIHKLKEILNIERLPEEHLKPYHTLAGFILNQLQRVPSVLDEVEFGQFKFVVTAMKGRRIDRVGVSLVKTAVTVEAATSAPAKDKNAKNGNANKEFATGTTSTKGTSK